MILVDTVIIELKFILTLCNIKNDNLIDICIFALNIYINIVN